MFGNHFDLKYMEKGSSKTFIQQHTKHTAKNREN